MESLQPIAAVCLVLVLLGGTLLLLKKRGAASFRLPRMASSGPRRMEVLERVSLGPQHTLHLVRLGDKSMVVATAASSCQLLCEVTSTAVEKSR